MVRSRKRKSPSPGYRRRTPLVLRWFIGLAGATALLVALAYLSGSRADKPRNEGERILDGVSSPGIALAIAFAALVFAAWCLRHMLLHRLAWRPGRIEVARFTAGSKLTEGDPEDLTIFFRRQLATLRLQAPTPVPGAAPEGDFLDVLSAGTADSRNIIATLLNVLRAGVPDHAYEIQGVLNESEEPPRYSITVQVVELPSESTLPIKVQGDSWRAVISEAADEATAMILPRTRHCRAPWATWRGRVMPRGLLHAYEEATRFEQDRRYDEALHAYFKAAELDPMNAALRLRIGHLQERMGLFLDALATYWGIEATTSGLPFFTYRGAARRQNRRAQLSARYRRVVLLGGRVLTEQWRAAPEPEESRRDRKRAELRACLRPDLQRELEQRLKIKKANDKRRLMAALSDHGLGRWQEQDDDPYFRALRGVFAQYAVLESRSLARRLRRRFFDGRTTLTPSTALVTAECIKVRQERLAYLRDPDRRWPTPPTVIGDRIAEIEERGFRRSFKLWHEHYNSACAYALALQDTDNVTGEVRDTLARAAVSRLEKATTRADSAYIGRRRDWLLSEDPDLKGLRATTEFQHFEVMYLPAGSKTPRRPQNVQQLESSRYMKALLVATAQRWQTAWHRRARELDSTPDIHDVLDWFTHELAMWSHVRAVAQDYRHTATRLELIHAVARCAARYDLPPLDVAAPRYEDDPLDDDSCEDAAQNEVDQANGRLRDLGCELHKNRPEDPATKLIDELSRWHATLRLVDAASRAPSRYLLAQLCDHHAAMWQLLEQWLTAPYDIAAGTEAMRRFHRKVEQTRAVWYGALAGWLPYRDALEATGATALSRTMWLRHQASARFAQVRVTATEWVGPHRQNGRVAAGAETAPAP
jgi:hypothetical protein